MTYRHANAATMHDSMVLRTDPPALLESAVWDTAGPLYDPNTTATARFADLPAGVVWARVSANSWNSDSMYVTYSGYTSEWHWGGPTGGYVWKKTPVTISGGVVYFRTREHNARLNCIAVLPAGQTPNDADALIAFGEEPPPPPPPVKEWPFGKLGMGIPVDPGWPGWDAVQALDYSWFWNWQVDPPWSGVPDAMMQDPVFVPTAWGRPDNLYLSQLQGEHAWLNDGKRPLFILNEPELNGQGNKSPSQAAAYVRECASFWNGPMYGIGTLTRPQSRSYLREVKRIYGADWPLTGYTCHVYTNVDHSSGADYVEEWVINSAIKELKAFRDEFGGPIIVNEYGGLTYNTSVQRRITEWEKVRLFEVLYHELMKILEVIALSPFSSWFAQFPTGDHIDQLGNLTPIGSLFNDLANQP